MIIVHIFRSRIVFFFFYVNKNFWSLNVLIGSRIMIIVHIFQGSCFFSLYGSTVWVLIVWCWCWWCSWYLLHDDGFMFSFSLKSNGLLILSDDSGLLLEKLPRGQWLTGWWFNRMISWTWLNHLSTNPLFIWSLV